MSTDSAYPTFQHYGTNAQRLAFTPAPPATQPIYQWYESDTDTTWIYTTSWHQVSGSGGGVTASGTLTANNVILGNGTSVVKALGSLGTTTTVLHGNAAGAPSFAAVTSSDVNNTIWTGTVSSGVLKASAQGTLAAATDGTDYLSPATGLTLIETKTPTTGNSVTFSSLGSFTHLQLIYSVRSDVSATSASINIQFNADTGSNYDSEDMFASGSTAAGSESLAAASIQVGSVVGATGTASVAGSGTIYIYDYRGTTFHKTLYALNVLPRLLTSTNIFSQAFGGRWRNTAAITSITSLLGSSSNYVTGSKLSLYGMP